MKFKGTAGMMVVFLSLGLYYFFVDVPTEKKKAEEKAAKKAHRILKI